MIAANSVSSGVSWVPPPCGRTFNGGISCSVISHGPSGTIQLQVPRPMTCPTSQPRIGHGRSISVLLLVDDLPATAEIHGVETDTPRRTRGANPTNTPTS